MIVWMLLLATVALAGTSLWLLFRSPSPRHPLRWISDLSLGFFIFLYGTWLYASVYLKWAFLAVAVATALRAIITRGHPTTERPSRIANLGSAITLLITVPLCVLYFTGTRKAPGSVDLQFPLKHGTYLVFQGGRGLPTNLFHSTGRGTPFAMDLVRLNTWGNRAKAVFSKRLDDYCIFGDTVFAPCDGIIERAINDNPDNTPPNRERGPHNLNGVVIQNPEFTVFLGHFKQNGVLVTPGQQVVAGQPLGLAGNSGYSLEPHLHLQAHRRTGTGQPWYLEPNLLIRFDGKEFLLFEQIESHR